MSFEAVSPAYSSRHSLMMAAASLCFEAGFENAEELVLDTLVEMLQSCISEIGKSIHSYCEHSNRTIPTVLDVSSALADLGLLNKSIILYMHRTHRIKLGQLSRTSEPLPPPVLQVGKAIRFPNYISENYNFPHFPDPHAYIRTMTGKKPENDYVILRERTSSQKRDVERALTRFVAKTGRSFALLPDDKNAFPLIAAQPTALPYVAGLLPSELEIHKGLEIKSEGVKESPDEDLDAHRSKQRHVKHKRVSNEHNQSQSMESYASDNARSNRGYSLPHASIVIHNPYLRPVKNSKIKKKTLT